jgi:hypothetical protein
VFRNSSHDKFIKLKQDLYDSGVNFFDGTHFNGDRFRLDELIKNQINNSDFTLKILHEQKVLPLLEHVKIMEVFQFFIDSPLSISCHIKHIQIQINNIEQAIQMLN